MNNNMRLHPRFNNVVEKPKRTRTAFTTHQLCTMEVRFQEKPTIDRENRRELAAELGLTENSVKVWFQNRRMKEKKKNKSGGSNSAAEDLQHEANRPCSSKFERFGFIPEVPQADGVALGNGYGHIRMAPNCQQIPGQQPELPYGHGLQDPYPVNSGSVYPSALSMQWHLNGAYNPSGADPHQPPVAVHQHPAQPQPQPPATAQDEQGFEQPQEQQPSEAAWVSDAYGVLYGYDMA